jgi:hypothetical protein
MGVHKISFAKSGLETRFFLNKQEIDAIFLHLNCLLQVYGQWSISCITCCENKLYLKIELAP